MANLDRTIYLLIALVVGITVHEACHAFSAAWLGDPTPGRQGRTTLNPLAHLDPLGSVMMLFMVISGVGLGWGKPVQINPGYLRPSPKVGFALSSLAGPVSNLVLAAVSACILGIAAGVQYQTKSEVFGVEFLEILVVVNVVLAIFNLIPIPPLDGFHTLLGILPDEIAAPLMRIEQYGIIILLAFLYFGLGRYLYLLASPVIDLLMRLAVLTSRLVI